MQSELKLCPFCGCSDIRINIHRSTAPHHHGETAYSIGCYQCGGSVPSRYDRSLLISFWNTRASDAEITRLTEALRAAEEREKGLREALFNATALIGHSVPMDTTALVAGEQLTAQGVWLQGAAALKGPSHD